MFIHLLEITLFSIIFLIYSYFDIKKRVIENRFFILSFLLVLGLEIIEYYFRGKIWFLLFLKIINIIIITLLVFFLFCIKFIGGADGKLIILIFFSINSIDLFFPFIILFFINFCLFFLVYLLSRALIYYFIYNRTYYQIFFREFDITNFAKKISYRIIARPLISNLKKKDTHNHYLHSKALYHYNDKMNFKLAIRIPPLTIFISFSYYMILIFDLFDMGLNIYK